MGYSAFVDLTRSTVSVLPTSDDELDRFLGGRGLGARLLFARGHPDPLSPAAPLILTTGPFTGTTWPASARGHVTFRSPLTGIYGYANSGGHFWAALRRAGFDAIASIINDLSRAAARCGGAVMGAKRLKAVLVHPVPAPPAPPEFARRAAAARRLATHPATQGLRRFGTPVLVAPKNASGDLPARNHQEGQVPYVGALIRLQPMLDRYYALRGWTADGVPTAATLQRLGLGEYVAELPPVGAE